MVLLLLNSKDSEFPTINSPFQLLHLPLSLFNLKLYHIEEPPLISLYGEISGCKKGDGDTVSGKL